MRAWTLIFVVFAWASSMGIMKAQAQNKSNEDKPAPMVKPELLFSGHIGGANDQMFVSVTVRGNTVVAKGPMGRYAAMVRLNPDYSFKSVAPGGAWGFKYYGKATNSKPKFRAALKGHRVSFGFNQVSSLLQQPWVKIDGEELYGWSASEAKKSKGPWAPYMADSRTTLVSPSNEKGYYFIAGTSDGGNSSFNTLPKDIDTRARFNNKMSTNFPNGKSTWCFVYNKKGEQLYSGFRLRGTLHDIAYDSWGRPIMIGKGIATAERVKHTLNIRADGGGIIMLNKEHNQRLFVAAAGSDLVAFDFDEKTGIFAAVGYYTHKPDSKAVFKQHNNSIQNKPGGGKDAVLVVWRMWDPDLTEAQKKRIETWKAKQDK